MKGLFIGRFQPFHNGHLQVIKEMASQSDKLILGIGSAQLSHTTEDPFTAGERHLMISEALDAEKVTNYYIIPIIDINRYKVWVAHVTSLVPPFDVIYTNNELTATLFKESGIDVVRPKLYDRSMYSGKEVRRRMAQDEDWQELVPDPVVKVIEELKGVERMRTLAKGGSA